MTDQFDQPEDPDTSVWRYQDLAKFVDLVASRSLYLCRVDLLGDPYEGTYPHLYKEAVQKAKQELPEGSKEILTVSGLALIVRLAAYVNCWCMHDQERDALWRIYTGNHGGLALRTNYSRMVQCLPSDLQVGKVRYIDFDTTAALPDDDVPFMHKRNVFSYENEIRIVRDRTLNEEGPDGKPRPAAGDRIQVDLDALIEEVVVSPYAPDWYKGCVERVAKAFGLSATVRWSSMRRPPNLDYFIR